MDYLYPLKRFSWLVLLLTLSCLLLLSACGDDAASKPKAQTLIINAQTAIQKVSSYHFNLNVEHPGNNPVLTIQKADGDIQTPDKLKAQANALIAGGSIQVQLIAIKDKQYVTDPISGMWHATNGLLDPRALSDPQTGVSAILGHIQNPSGPESSDVDGTACWNTNGKLDARYLSGITGGAPSNSQVDVSTCIGKKDNLPYLIKMSGVATQGDTAQTVRTFKLSKFGESLNIQSPA